MTDGLTVEVPVVSFVLENEVDNTSKFFGNDGAGNGFIGPAADLLVEAPVLREVSDGMDGHIRERDLPEIEHFEESIGLLVP